MLSTPCPPPPNRARRISWNENTSEVRRTHIKQAGGIEGMGALEKNDRKAHARAIATCSTCSRRLSANDVGETKGKIARARAPLASALPHRLHKYVSTRYALFKNVLAARIWTSFHWSSISTVHASKQRQRQTLIYTPDQACRGVFRW